MKEGQMIFVQNTQVKGSNSMLLNKKQAAEILGISVRLLDDYRAKFDLPTLKLGGGVCRFYREELLDWAAQFRQGKISVKLQNGKARQKEVED